MLAVVKADAGVLVHELAHAVRVGLDEAELVMEGVLGVGEFGCGHVGNRFCGCSQQSWRSRADSAPRGHGAPSGAAQHSANMPPERACFTTGPATRSN